MHHNTADFPSLTISGGREDPTARAPLIIGINHIQILYCVFTRLNFAPFILLISIHQDLTVSLARKITKDAASWTFSDG